VRSNRLLATIALGAAAVALSVGAAVGQTTTSTTPTSAAPTTTTTRCGGEPPPEVKREAQANPGRYVDFECGGQTYSYVVRDGVGAAQPAHAVRRKPSFTG
jgi:hypothetical protein